MRLGMTINTPLFSVVTITRNNLAGLKKTAQSIESQTCADYEWIVIDGASTDETAKFLSAKNILFYSEPDQGIYDAMNKGIERARGKYLIFMNAGDRFAEETILARVGRLLTEKASDLLYGDATEGNQIHSFYKTAKPETSIDFGLFTHHQAIFYRKETLGNLRYNLNYSVAADYDFTRQFIKKAHTVQYMPFAICLFEPGGVSQRHARQGRQEQFIIRSRDGVSAIKNAYIYARQSMAWTLRRLCPALYEAWKARAPQAGNKNTARAPDEIRPGHP